MTESIERPSAKGIEDAKQQWGQSERFRVQEESLQFLYRKWCPNHTEPAEVLLKVTVLNAFYSTRILAKDLLAVAERIVELNPGNRIAEGDTSLVNELAVVSVAGKNWEFYSFASKYCSQHNPDKFPIYDGYVDEMLWHFRLVDKFAKFKRKELKNYPRFVVVVHAFKEFYELKESLRWIDRYLWFNGREIFG